MDKKTLRPENFEERVVWYSITMTYPIYLIGGLYILAPVVGWIMLAYLCKKLWMQQNGVIDGERVFIPWGVWVWTLSMFVMLIALWMGHLDWQLGTATTTLPFGFNNFFKVLSCLIKLW